MADEQVHDVIERLVAEEHRLMELEDSGEATADDRTRLGEVRVQLDRFWDLLRQRRAERAAGRDPEDASLRDAGTVEEYEQ
ncbi:DUF2630 family protein [Miltoncostaea marina]|uniref:DUF2630 family protein n=1 Tax=Miltoncostaea marina TaxID=2843215 RepID=UPI001C3D1DBA|nr:DUF2630 family protein [Miltoncostaea marina]